jgi:hypothetical protein
MKMITGRRDVLGTSVSVTHGTAHLALYVQAMWDKYQLTGLAGESRPAFTTHSKVAR